MRISRVQLVGLAVALAGGGAQQAAADDLTVTGSLTDPVFTSSAANSSAGNVTVNSGGTITVDAGETAITMDSNNNVSNGGALKTNNASNTAGIAVSGTRVGTITNSGTITLLEDATLSDTDNDGDLDGDFASGTNRHGILIGVGSSLTGDIINSGTINVKGENSNGIWINGLLDGDLNSTGLVSAVGDNSAAYRIDDNVTGDVLLRGQTTVYGENAAGLLLNGTVDGEVRIRGAWVVSGYHSTTRPADVSHLDADDLLQSGSAVAIYGDIGGGLIIEGTGVENDLDDDGDTIEEPTDTDDNLAASITQSGSAPAILVQANGSALALGASPYAGGYGFVNRGQVTANGVYDGVSSTTVRFEGLSGGTVSTAAGINNDGRLNATAFEADSTNIYIGSGVTANMLLNRNTMSSIVASQGADTAYNILIDAGASVPNFVNDGTIAASLLGETGDAVSIRDLSNTLTSITNTGTISAVVSAADSDPITGSAIAIDVSASSVGVTINQIEPTPFTDDDTVDNDASSRPAVLIRGDILFGSGADALNLEWGSVIGDLSFGAGADTFLIDNGAIFTGSITDSDGNLAITVNDGQFNMRGGTTNISTATFGADSEFSVLLSQTPADTSYLHASGTITFDVGAVISPVLPSGLPVTDTILFLTADGGLFGGANVIGDANSGSFLYTADIELTNPLAANGDPNGLEVTFTRKTAADLGLTANQTAAFDPILASIVTDADASAALAAIDNEVDFFDAYQDLMPNFASAAAELAATAIQQGQSATSNRLATTRLHGLNQVSVWTQEIGYGLNREPPSANGVRFRGTGFGLAAGIDGPLNNGGLFGLSASFIASEAEEPGRRDGEISASIGQANAYLGLGMGVFDVDLIGGVGVGKMQSRRFIDIGNSFESIAEADWWSYEGHGAVRISAPMQTGSFVMTPQAALTYVFMAEDGYTEEGAGDALDYDADSATSQRLWGDLGVQFSTQWHSGQRLVISPRVFLGYRANLIDDPGDRTFQFVSGGNSFTLQDEGLGDGGPLVGIGFDSSNGYSTVSVGYEGEFGDQIERHSLNVALRVHF